MLTDDFSTLRAGFSTRQAIEITARETAGSRKARSFCLRIISSQPKMIISRNVATATQTGENNELKVMADEGDFVKASCQVRAACCGSYPRQKVAQAMQASMLFATC